MALQTFPFIVGCPRSGTTLLRRMLASHPDLAIPPETWFITAMARRRFRYERGGAFHVEAFLKDLREQHRFPRMEVSEELLRKEYHARPPKTFSEAIRGIFSVYAHLQGKHLYGDKTPGYVTKLPVLSRLFPESKFIHIIRDGRNVALSVIEMTFGPNTIGEGALYWKGRVERGRADGRALDPDRYLEVRYEDLVESPAPVLRGICDFSGLDYDECMVAGINVVPKKRLLRPDLKALDWTGPRKWRDQLTTQEVALFESVAGDLLMELGYPLESGEMTVVRRLQAITETALYRARRAKLRTRRRLYNAFRRSGLLSSLLTSRR